MTHVARLFGPRRPFFVTIVLLSLIGNPALASVTLPKIGDCKLYVADDIYGINAQGKNVNCSKLHNSEIFKFIKLSPNLDIKEITPIAFMNIASKYCGESVNKSTFFNQWVYRVPTQAKWKAGERWLVCEAIKVQESDIDSGKLVPISFKSKKLDFK